MGRMIQWEFVHELNAFRLLGADPAVSAYHEQPLTIRFVLGGKTRIRHPDLLVEWRQRRELWEIKPEIGRMDPSLAEETRFLENALPKVGFLYRLIEAEDLAREPRLSNALTLLNYGRKGVSDVAREHVRRILLTAPAIPWTSATNGDLGARGCEVLCRLALEGFLSFDMDRQLTAMTPFSLADAKNG
jgi:hypothetical protein